MTSEPASRRSETPAFASSRPAPAGSLRLALGQAGFAFLASVTIKLALVPLTTPDMAVFLLPWLQHVEARGLAAVGDTFTDYAPGYTYLLLLVAPLAGWLPGIAVIKLLSITADCVMAVCGGVVVARASGDAARGAFAAALLAGLPSVVLNSGVWGQNDSIWTSAILVCVLAMTSGRPTARATSASLWFGLALAFKPQAVFLGPLLVGFLLAQRAAGRLLLVPLPYLLLAAPMLIAGRSWTSVFGVYVSPAMSETEALSNNAASLWTWISPLTGESQAAGIVGVVCAVLVGGVMARAAARPTARTMGRNERSADLVIGAALCCTLMPFLLPKMHDRYFFAGEVLAAMAACLRPSLLLAAVATQTAALLAYHPFLLALAGWRVPVATGFSLIAILAFAFDQRSVLWGKVANHSLRQRSSGTGS
jgi:hypothetical protein